MSMMKHCQYITNLTLPRPVRIAAAISGVSVAILGAGWLGWQGSYSPAVMDLAPASQFSMMYQPANGSAVAMDTSPAVPMPATASRLTPVLDAAQSANYQFIFNAQTAGDWAVADEAIASLTDNTLLGHVKAQRYLSRRYVSSYEELHAWLGKYADHPQAYKIYQLAIAKRRNGDEKLITIAKRSVLLGYGDDNGLAGLKRMKKVNDTAWNGRDYAYAKWQRIDSLTKAGELGEAQSVLSQTSGLTSYEYDVARWSIAASALYHGQTKTAYQLASASANRNGKTIPRAHWVAGLASWKLHDKKTAARHFAAMAGNNNLTDWEQSAAAYWAYRAYNTLGNTDKAQRFLTHAAEHPRTFYGALARHANGTTLGISQTTPPRLSPVDQHALYAAAPGAKRAVALVQAGQEDAADMEMRFLFPAAAGPQKTQLLSLAHTLRLPAVQITMARAISKDGPSYDTALYPSPRWEPVGGFEVDPALVFAFMRQESGFRKDAQSYAGAMGVMQLMPATAKSMKQRQTMLTAMPKESIFEPEANMALGQTYLAHLMQETGAKDNLIFLAAAYNAGPGNLLKWKKSADMSDPLLFMETIPFAETRNYVAQVLTNYWIYRELAGKEVRSAERLSNAEWPRYTDETYRMTADANTGDQG